MSRALRASLLVCLFVFSIVSAAAEELSEEDARYRDICFQAIETFLRVAREGTNPRAHYHQLANLAEEKLESGELVVSVDKENDKLIFGGAHFTVMKEGPPALVLGYRLADLYETRPSVALSIIAHELQHARDFFTQREYFETSYHNEIKKYMFEADAIYIEAMFVAEVLEPKGYNLSRWEKYLARMYRARSLESIFMAAMGIDLDILHAVYELGGREHNGLGHGAVQSELVELLESNLETAREGRAEEPWMRYVTYAQINSAVLLSQELIRVTEGSVNPELTWEEVFLKWPDYKAAYDEAVSFLLEHKDEWLEFKAGLMTDFEKDLNDLVLLP